MKLPIDVATRVSDELSKTMERLVADPDRDEPPTLADVRAALRRAASAAERRAEKRHPQLGASTLDEVDELIEEFGGEAAAIDFVRVKAGEALSRIIETALADARMRRKTTLGMVRDAMADGLVARLVGDGTIEADEDQSVMAEIDGLIGRYGDEAVAEEFIRFE